MLQTRHTFWEAFIATADNLSHDYKSMIHHQLWWSWGNLFELPANCKSVISAHHLVVLTQSFSNVFNIQHNLQNT